MRHRLASYTRTTALITGASSGIGRCIALEIGRQGGRVALVARREPELALVAQEIEAAGGEALVLPCDVGDREQVEGAASRARDHWQGIDLLVNNAGYGARRPFSTWDVADLEQMMRVNYLGAVYFTKALLPDMIDRGRGWLVFLASVAGKIATAGETGYVASKFAMVGLAESLSLEVEDQGIHVLTVCPGIVRTPFFTRERQDAWTAVERRSSVEPEALASAISQALARGDRTLTYPRAIAAAYPVQALAPEFTRRRVKKATQREP